MPTTPADGTVSVLILRALLLGAGLHGLGPDELSAHTHLAVDLLSPAAVADPDARVPARVVLTLWQQLPVLTGNDEFGLWLARKVGAAPITPAGWFVSSSPTMAQGLERVVRFQRLLHDHSRSALRADQHELCYVHQIGDRAFRAPRHAIEFGFAQALLMVRRAFGTEVLPRRVCFQHAAPADTSAHRRWFGDAVSFGADGDELAFERELCEQPLPTRDDALGELILSHARVLLERLPSDETWAARVRRAIALALPRDVLGLEAVAQQLGATKRTLQRRLAEESTSFDEILDAVRSELAERYLGEQRLSAQDCAFLLGYSDLSAFHRAFQRWHGVSIAEHRAARQKLHEPEPRA